MDPKEVISQLRAELSAIQTELRLQYARLQQIERTLQQMDPAGAPITKPAEVRKGFSLENFVGLKLMHLVGIVVLVIGVVIGVKYAFDRNLISPVARIGLAYAAGLLLLATGLRLRVQYDGFSAILFSGAMATLYFTSYAAHAYYLLLPFALVFGMMVLFTVATAWQAVRYNRQEIALLGLVGAYAIPFLISRNAERADLLFVYMTIINAGVLYLRLRRPWPMMGYAAMILSWTLFIGWASTRYSPPQAGTAYLFLPLFFLLFTVLVFGKITHAVGVLKQQVHMQLLNNVAAFSAAVFVVRPALQMSSLSGLAILFALLAGVQAYGARRWQGRGSYAGQTLALLAVGWVVLAALWYFDGLEVTFSWLVVAVALFVLGGYNHSRLWRLAALGLMALTLLKLLVADSQRFTAGQKVIAFITLGLLLLVVSFFYQKFKNKWFGE